MVNIIPNDQPQHNKTLLNTGKKISQYNSLKILLKTKDSNNYITNIKIIEYSAQKINSTSPLKRQSGSKDYRKFDIFKHYFNKLPSANLSINPYSTWKFNNYNLSKLNY